MRKKEYTGKYPIEARDLAYAKAYSLKYPRWLTQYNSLKDAVKAINYDNAGGPSGRISDTTADNATKRMIIRGKMMKVEQCAFEAGGDLAEYILKSVIDENVTFEDMKAAGMPCERRCFYEKRRKYYYLLNQII